jgi:hypothetical protein
VTIPDNDQLMAPFSKLSQVVFFTQSFFHG